MEQQQQLKWYQKPNGVIILLIIFFPIGLYLMWQNKLWTNKTRWMISGFFALLVIANASNNSSIDQGSWSGSDTIAGVKFDYVLKKNSDNNYSLNGNAGGMSVNESGSFEKISDNELVIISGDFSGSKFKMDGSSMKWYLDNGDFFMTLY